MGVSDGENSTCKGPGRTVLGMFRKLQVSSGIKAGLSGAQEASDRDGSHKRVGAEGSGLTGHLVWRRKMVGTAQPSPRCQCQGSGLCPSLVPSAPVHAIGKGPGHPTLGRRIWTIPLSWEAVNWSPEMSTPLEPGSKGLCRSDKV